MPTSVQNAAKRTIAERQVIQLSVSDSHALVETLLINTCEPSARMQERVEAYTAMIGD